MCTMEYQSSINTWEVICDMVEIGGVCYVAFTKYRNKHYMISLMYGI